MFSSAPLDFTGICCIVPLFISNFINLELLPPSFG
jgi:hypothetical protein